LSSKTNEYVNKKGHKVAMESKATTSI